MWKSIRTGVAVLVFIVGMTGLSVPVHANEIGSFFVTANYGLGDFELSNNFTTYRIDDLGFSAGFTLPIIKKKYAMLYKGRVAVHGVEDLEYGDNPSPDDPTYYRNMGTYISSLNELMVGRKFNLSDDVYVHALLGFGVLVNIIYENGPGIAHGSFQFDLTTQWMYRLKSFDMGVQLTLEHVPWDGYFGRTDVTYMTLGVVIAK